MRTNATKTEESYEKTLRINEYFKRRINWNCFIYLFKI